MAALFLLIAAVVVRRSVEEPPFIVWALADSWLLAATLAGTVGVGVLALAAGWLPWNRPARGHAAWSRSARRTRWVGTIACAWLAFCVLGLGWFDLVRARLGDWILLDEAITISPAIVAQLIAWWAHEPFARRHGQAASRLGFVVTQARIFLPLLLIPVSVVLASQEIVARTLAPTGVAAEVVGLSVAVVTLLLAPALVVPALSTGRLPERDGIAARVEGLFREQRIPVSGVRLWNTGGTLMNGVALGLLPFCRWVLLSDALVDGLLVDETLAVAGHEAGHLRHRHAAWLAGTCIATVGCASLSIQMAAIWAGPLLPEAIWVEAAKTGLLLGVVLLVFGVASRGCERQADAYAAQALSRGEVVEVEAVDAMRRALAVVAYANGIPVKRPSFRHGSIDGRRRRLAGLTGRSKGALPIDRRMRVARAFILAGVVVTAAALVRESIESMKSRTSTPTEESTEAAEAAADLAAEAPLVDAALGGPVASSRMIRSTEHAQ